VKGDFTRNPSAREGQYSRVLLQQGRVQLDSDFNEQVEITALRERRMLADLIGPHGAPHGSRGFEIKVRHFARLQDPSTYFRAAALPDHFENEYTIESRILLHKESGGGTIVSTWDSDRLVGFELGFDAHRRLFLRRAKTKDKLVEDVVEYEFMLGDVDVFVKETSHHEVQGASESVLRSHRSLPPDRYVHVVATFHSRACNLYLDGVLVAHHGSTYRDPASKIPLRVGGFSGEMGQTRIWKQAFSEREVGKLFASSPPHRPVIDYRFEETEGRILVDHTGGGMDATYEGSLVEWGHDLWVEEGRYYVGGYPCENPQPVRLVKPGSYPYSGSYLAYLDAWERHVSSHEDPALREIALPKDTGSRVETVAHVRLLPFEQRSKVESPEDIEEWRRHLSIRSTHGRMRVRRTLYDQNLDNLLYRIEVHSGGVPRTKTGESGSSRIESWDASNRTLSLKRWAVDGLPWRCGDVVEAWDRSSIGEPVCRSVARVVSVDAAARTLGLDEIGASWDTAPLYIRRVPTFKWSRYNGSRVFPIASVDSRGWAALAIGYGEQPDLQEGGWVELGSRATELAGQTDPLYQIVEINEISRMVRLFPLPPVTEENGLLRVWDQMDSLVVPASGTVAAHAGEWIDLEKGVQIEFDGQGLHHAGDSWSFVTRKVLGGVDWPRESGQPCFMPPQSGKHVFAPLAWIDLADGVPSIRASYRRSFDSLTRVTQDDADFVRRTGDTMTGPLRIEDSLHVRGEVHARRFQGALPDNSVGVEQLRDASVTEQKLAFEIETTVESCLLRETPAPVEGHRFMGAQIVVPYPGPLPTSNHRIHAAAMGRSIFVLDQGKSWLLRPYENVAEECQSPPFETEDFTLSASRENAYVVQGGRKPALYIFRKEFRLWETGPEPPRFSSRAAATVHDGLLYVAGGSRRVFFWRKTSAKLHVFDPARDLWSELVEMPRGRESGALTAFDGELLIAGGVRHILWGLLGTHPIRSVFSYDIATDHWGARASLPEEIARPSFAHLGRTPILFGGRDPLRYRPERDRWQVSAEFDVDPTSAIVSVRDALYRVDPSSYGPPRATLLAKALYVFESDNTHGS